MMKSKVKTSNSERLPSCFAESDAPSGIAFEKADGTKRFAPYSFLSCVDFDEGGELVFRYTFGTITVRGEALESLWNALCRGTLNRVNEQAGESATQDVILIRAIVIEDEYDGVRNPVSSE